jgi:hypothetical protein
MTVVRIPPLLRGSVYLCSFEKVFSCALGIGHVRIVMSTNLHSIFGENQFWSEVGASWFCVGVLGIHTHKKV